MVVYLYLGPSTTHFVFFYSFFIFLFIFFYLLALKIPSSFNVLVEGVAALMREKGKMGYKVRCAIFFRDLCNTIDKTDKKSVYLLFSIKSNWRRRRKEFKRRISNNTLKNYICKGQEVVFRLQWISRVWQYCLQLWGHSKILWRKSKA